MIRTETVVFSRPAARMFSLLLASALSLLILIMPILLLDEGKELDHNQLMLVMWGIAAGFVHGVGFVPRNKILQVLLGPVTAWLLMSAGCLWFFT